MTMVAKEAMTTMANKKKQGAEQETVSMTVSIPKAIHTRARMACVGTGRTLAEAVAEALNAWAKTVAS